MNRKLHSKVYANRQKIVPISAKFPQKKLILERILYRIKSAKTV
jgi:hypothetical protein